MEFEFTPVDFDYFDRDGRNFVRMIGRDGDGKKVCVVDSYDANFYLILEDGADEEKIVDGVLKVEVSNGGRSSKVLRCEVLDKKYLGRDVRAIRVFVPNHKDAHGFASAIGEVDGILKRREYDLSLVTKYIKEKGVEPLKRYLVKAGRVNGFGDLDCFEAESFEKMDGAEFVPRILAYDIETSEREIGRGEIYCISLYSSSSVVSGESVSDELKKVLTWKKAGGVGKYVEFCEDEADMIEKFCEYVRGADVDTLCGYFSDGFDLPYLKKRADENGVVLDLGVDGRGPSFSRGRIPSGKISGVVHVDVYRFVSSVFAQYLQSETLSLNEVAKELVGEEKEDFDFVRLANMKDKDWKDFFSYNLQDSVVTWKLAEKVWPDVLEFCRIVKEPVFDVTRDSMSAHVENYIVHNLDRFGEIAEKRPGYDEIGERKAKGKYEGAFVFEPTPGFYEDLVMFDFTSMYASVIVSYNLSKASLNSDGSFSKNESFVPLILREIIEKRKVHKKAYAENNSGILRARSNAYKLLANATYGYQGFFGARYYCREAAAATAHFAKENILRAIDIIKKGGYTIIYSDTDSIAFLRGGKSKEEVLDFLKKINDGLPGIMELDLEDFYKRGLFVAKRQVGGSRSEVRDKNVGAKKKYALIGEDGKVKIRGFETVRRDWCRLTRNLQSEVLGKILREGDEKRALEIFRKVVDDLKNRKVDLEDLMIRTQLRRPVNDYKSEGPHVVAARKMIEAGVSVSTGMLIEYFVGEGNVDGSAKKAGGRVRDRVYLAGEKARYDVDYYLQNQLVPCVEGIFDVFGVSAKEVVSGSEQRKLF